MCPKVTSGGKELIRLNNPIHSRHEGTRAEPTASCPHEAQSYPIDTKSLVTILLFHRLAALLTKIFDAFGNRLFNTEQLRGEELIAGADLPIVHSY